MSFDLHPEIQNVSRETFSKFEKHFELIERFRRVMSLNHFQNFDAYVENAILPVLFMSKYVNKQLVILDFGSGSGIPGVLLAILGHFVVLNEIHKKKCEFLIEVIRLMEIENISVLPGDVRCIEQRYDQITCQAVADIDLILTLTQNVSRETTRYILPKGPKVLTEIDMARKKWDFDVEYVKHPVSEKHILAILQKVQKNG